jgi:glyoxylase-like metal-dependent hydrolase (beta-lactamase superfamily II)
LRELPPNELPGLPDWKWLHTPGHSPGHISVFRESDGVLIAGDAFATMDMDSWTGLISGKQTLARAGSPFNCDWEATKNSVQTLAKLRPNVIGAGHGIPLTEENVAQRLENYATRFRPPRHGRYVHERAETNENGVVSLPPAPFDPVPFATAASLLLAGIALGAGAFDDKTR